MLQGYFPTAEQPVYIPAKKRLMRAISSVKALGRMQTIVAPAAAPRRATPSPLKPSSSYRDRVDAAAAAISKQPRYQAVVSCGRSGGHNSAQVAATA